MSHATANDYRSSDEMHKIRNEVLVVATTIATNGGAALSQNTVVVCPGFQTP